MTKLTEKLKKTEQINEQNLFRLLFYCDSENNNFWAL